MPTIRQLREQKGWSRQYLAEKSRVSIPTIYRLETDEHPATTFNNLLRICEALGVKLEDVEGVSYGQSQNETASDTGNGH